MKVIERIEQLQSEFKKVEEKYCAYCQDYFCVDCLIEYEEEQE